MASGWTEFQHRVDWELSQTLVHVDHSLSLYPSVSFLTKSIDLRPPAWLMRREAAATGSLSKEAFINMYVARQSLKPEHAQLLAHTVRDLIPIVPK